MIFGQTLWCFPTFSNASIQSQNPQYSIHDKKEEFPLLHLFRRGPANHLLAYRNAPSIDFLTHFALIPSLVQPWAQWVILYCLLL